MLPVLLDVFAEDILDYLTKDDLQRLIAVFPSTVRMYKSLYMDTCFNLPPGMYIECSHCDEIKAGKTRKGLLICNQCVVDIITIPIS